MPKMKLTQLAVEKLRPPPSGRVDYWDTQLPGFGLRVSAPRPGHQPRKTWQAMYYVRGEKVRETIGTLALIPKVESARARARQSMELAQQGVRPADERREAAGRRAETARLRHDTLGAVLDRYLAEYGAKRWRPEYLKEVGRSFAVDLRPLRERPIREVARRDLRELIDSIVRRDRAPHAHHVLAYLRPALGWAVGNEIIEANPAAGVPDPDPRRREARTRDRYLDEDEIRVFWCGCDRIGWPFGPLFQLLLLTAQRRDELAHATWRQFDLAKALWTLPRERTKNDKAHLVHLSAPAIEIIERLPRLSETEFLFTTTGKSPVSGFGRAGERLAAAMLDLRKAELGAAGEIEGAERARVEPFTLHDLRRTAATGMADIGVAPHVVDRILNHVTGTISGVARIYNRSEYLAERRQALDDWAKQVMRLVCSRSNVIPLTAQRLA